VRGERSRPDRRSGDWGDLGSQTCGGQDRTDGSAKFA
jgi:hypothetical protein